MIGIPANRAARVRVTSMVVGIVLLAYAGTAVANDVDIPGPGWDLIATTLAGVASLMVAAYTRGLERRISITEIGLSGLKDRVLTDYHDAQETERMITSALKPFEVALAHLSTQVAAIHTRLDRMDVPQARAERAGGKP